MATLFKETATHLYIAHVTCLAHAITSKIFAYITQQLSAIFSMSSLALSSYTF